MAWTAARQGMPAAPSDSGQSSRPSGFAAPTIAVTAIARSACGAADRATTSPEASPEQWRLVDTVRIGAVDGPNALTRVGALLALSGGAWFTRPMAQIVRVVDAD